MVKEILFFPLDYLNVAQYADYEEADQIRDADEKLEDMEAHKSVVLHLLSQLKLGMDLTRVSQTQNHVSVKDTVIVQTHIQYIHYF